MAVAAFRRRHRTLSQRVLWHVPQALVEYPVEVTIATWGLVSGPAILLGLSHPPAPSAAMPMVLEFAWAVAMLLGAGTVACGLWRGTYSTYVARGLALSGSVCAAYAVAILDYVGFAAGQSSAGMFAGAAFLCYARAVWLKTRAAVLTQIHHEAP